MPIFQADLELLLEGQAHDAPSEPSPATAGQARQSRPATSFLHPNLEQPALLRKLSEESIRTELCEGPVPDSPRPATADADLEASTSNRAELIERLKRGESPTWIPARRLESFYDGPPPPRQTRSPRPPADTSSLLPPADITPEKLKDVIAVDEEARLRDGLNIQRPRSALHSGDFTQIHAHAHPLRDSEDRTGPAPLQPPTHSWIATSPPRGYSPFDLNQGLFYLYKSIRIVFANRVPDGKEKLRNETTWPEPKFSTYKPIRVMNTPLSSTGPGAMLAAEKAFRRRSSGFSFGPSVQAFDAMDGVTHSRAPAQHSSPSLFSFGGNTQPVDPIPLRFPSRNRLGSDVSDSTDTTGLTGLRSPGSSQTSRRTTKDGLDAQIARYEKLNKGDVGYGGNAFAGLGRGSPGTEGLLSQRLRSLGVQGQGSPPPDDMD
ncbi:hypothetical protein BN1723_015321 [Verticillium longisporum]|uniref:Atos-like C-terminal domain-containing protein n=1 Tax=Verticillium longisporum TaxID=100787 RepID=A0A0G4MW30_VERLO|nr:hypothetical protein BN1723_015321 [Verticillium longisporum]